MKNKKLKLGIPKGSLQESTLDIFKRAGFDIQLPGKSYTLKIDDPEIECYLLRPQEIPRYIEKGKLDIGISGEDWAEETGAKVTEVCDLRYAKQEIKKIKWVLAVFQNSGIKSIKDLKGKIIATEIVNLAKKYLKKHGVKAEVEFSFGATEVKAPDFADAVIDLVETGAALKDNKLKVLDVVFESSTKLFANKDSLKDAWKKRKIEDLALLLEGAVGSRETVGLAINVPQKTLKRVLKLFPPENKKPTITKMPHIDWYDILASAEKKKVRKLIPKLKNLGCEGIVEFAFDKIAL